MFDYNWILVCTVKIPEESHQPQPTPLQLPNVRLSLKDKLYRAVNAANRALDEYKYHLAGGAAGTRGAPSRGAPLQCA